MGLSGPRELLVVSASGHARELASYVRALQTVGMPVEIGGVVDDYWFGSTFEDLPVIGGVKQLEAFLGAHRDRQFCYIVGTVDNRMRADLVRRVESLGAPNLTPWTLQHRTAVIGESVAVGAGTCVGPGVVVTTQVSIGEHCILNVNSSVAHESVLGPFVNVSQGTVICSAVTIGEGCTIGAGATLTEDIQVGAWSVVGAGAVVVNDVPPHVTVAGAPARIVQRHGRGMRQSSLAG